MEVLNTDDKISLFPVIEADLPLAAKVLLKFAASDRIITFYGSMGSGKTTFIKSVCIELGVITGMSSPSFSIVNEYLTIGSQKVYHFDFYRIKEEKEALEIGVEEYFDSGSYCLIEWPEKVLNLLPEPRIRVDIFTVNNRRQIRFSHE